MEENYTVNSGKFDTTGLINYNNNYCFNRLPCGICTRTNSFCPLGGQYNVTPTWGSTITTGTGNGPINAENITTGTINLKENL